MAALLTLFHERAAGRVHAPARALTVSWRRGRRAHG